jgi:hypothetical protein
MVTEVHIIKDQISKITKAIELRICIRGAWEGGEEGEVLPIPYIRPWLLPSASFPIYNSLFQSIQSEVRTAFFDKLQALI